jgi:hypothetical protein
LWPAKGDNVKPKGRNFRSLARTLNPFAGEGTNTGFDRRIAMTLKSLLAAISLALGLCLILASAEAAPMACPAKSHQMDDIIASLQAAKGCDAAMKVFEACQYGATGDAEFGEIVEKKCEADFLKKAGASKKQAYQRELGVCDRKYRNKSGTMYISFTAFCRAEVARRYSREARKAAGAK